MRLRAIMPLALLALTLAGCTWFNGPTTNALVDNVANQTTSPSVAPTVQVSTSEELRVPELGFATRFPEQFTVERSETCIEGCPGIAVPAFLFSLSTEANVASLAVYPTEERYLTLEMTAAQTLDEYLKSAAVTNVQQREVEGGTRYDFTIVGRPASAVPSIAPEAVPDRPAHLLVRDDGRMYQITANTSDDRAQEIAGQLADTLEFI